MVVSNPLPKPDFPTWNLQLSIPTIYIPTQLTPPKRMAEIAFGLLCSCLVVLPRLFQYLASIKPTKDIPLHPTPRTDKQSPSHPYSVIISANKGDRNSNNNSNDNTHWVQLSDIKNQPPPSKSLDETRSDDRKISEAVNGVDEGGDLERGLWANHIRS